MPAPNVPDLFDFETHYEDAAKAYFANVSSLANAQLLTPRTNINSEAILVTPRLAISTAITGTDRLQDGITPNTNVYFDVHKMGVLSLTLATSRNNSQQNHGIMRGAIRQSLLAYSAAFNATTLPYYQTVYLYEQSSVQSIDGTNDEIITQLTYAFEFAIQASQWPNS